MSTAISSELTAAFTVFGLLNFQKGISNVLAGPIGGALLENAAEIGGYGARKYEVVILFTGSCMLLSATIITLYHVFLEVDLTDRAGSIRNRNQQSTCL